MFQKVHCKRNILIACMGANTLSLICSRSCRTELIKSVNLINYLFLVAGQLFLNILLFLIPLVQTVLHKQLPGSTLHLLWVKLTVLQDMI